jgi:hypothetical protein
MDSTGIATVFSNLFLNIPAFPSFTPIAILAIASSGAVNIDVDSANRTCVQARFCKINLV